MRAGRLISMPVGLSRQAEMGGQSGLTREKQAAEGMGLEPTTDYSAPQFQCGRLPIRLPSSTAANSLQGLPENSTLQRPCEPFSRLPAPETSIAQPRRFETRLGGTAMNAEKTESPAENNAHSPFSPRAGAKAGGLPAANGRAWRHAPARAS